jgi:hypothetical protein
MAAFGGELIALELGLDVFDRSFFPVFAWGRLV